MLGCSHGTSTGPYFSRYAVRVVLRALVLSEFFPDGARARGLKHGNVRLFTPGEEGYEFKAIVTNKSGKARPILLFHNGRASRENMFSELKSQCNLDYVPTRRLSGNQLHFLSAVFAHNLYRELQMVVRRTDRPTTPKRAALWIFEEAASIRQKLI